MAKKEKTADLNFDELAKEFDMENVNGEIRDLKERLDSIEEINDPNQILKLNIERANYLLDLAESRLANGDFSSKILEACAGLISQITAAANSLVNVDFQNQNFDLKERTLNIKEFEVRSKVEQKEKSNEEGSQSITTNNILVADRESILSLFKSKNINAEMLESSMNNIKTIEG